MMLPAVTTAPIDAASASIEAAEAGIGAGTFAAAIAELREAEQGSAPAPEPPSGNAALVVEPIPATSIESIDWLLGQCMAPSAESMPTPAADGASIVAMACSTPNSTLAQMLGLRAGSNPSVPDTRRGTDLVAIASQAGPGTNGAAPANASLPTTADPQRVAEAVLVDKLLDPVGQGNVEREESGSIEASKSASQAIDTPPTPQVVRAEAAGKVATAALHTPVGTRAWNDELASKLTWLIDRGEQLASIRVTPDSLGPIDIRIAVREGEASIWFGANQADTRQAIEQAIPRLREMLAAQGLSLADAGVFQQAPNDPQRALLRNDLRRAAQESGEAAPLQSAVIPRRPGLIDDYA
jgi:flagellar hook-length control protein FliK